jgi:hypothetical protein
MPSGADSAPGEDRGQRVVRIEFASRREFVWPSATAAMTSWQIGDDVSYRGSRWRVVSRSEHPEVLTLELTPKGS